MKLDLALLAAWSAAVAAAEATGSPRSIDLGAYCYPPILNSDAAHLLSCPSEDLDPRYTAGPRTPPRPRKFKNRDAPVAWDRRRRRRPHRGLIVLTEAERARHLLKYAGFRDPDLAVSKAGGWVGLNTFNPKAKVVPIPGKEFGVTASLLVDYNAVYSLERTDVMRLQAFGIELLPTAMRDRVLNMSTHGSRQDVVHALEKVLVTNAFEVKVDDDNTNGLYALFPDTARMNHDCRPNVSYQWDYKTFTQYATALRTIYPGEELTVSYINGLRPYKKRRAALKRSWGFACSCPVCSLAELLISLLEQERMHVLMGEAYAYAALEWNGVGEAWTAARYARRAIEEEVMQLREEAGEDIEDMMALVDDPWEHWSWLWRTRKRMNWKPLDAAKKKEIDEAVVEAATDPTPTVEATPEAEARAEHEPEPQPEPVA
ncbi:unnamed protein product [Parascedosporium putredinis]|uniref:SET domain-containing protein n=1 Tax=Parascedosporium putredinis TaxID=1442378 RepID=A0A9P1H9A3_9PEZI|nr:unnamed protein product [Parascedosporium putredinis]CAI8003268.1 unnamed protein product [Parascedosporium putredinis]